MSSLEERLQSLGLGNKVVSAMLAGLAENLSAADIAQLLDELLGPEKAAAVADELRRRGSRSLASVPEFKDLRGRKRPGQDLELPLLEYMLSQGSSATVFFSELGDRARNLLAYTYKTSSAEFTPSAHWQDDDTQLRVVFERLAWACVVTNGFQESTDEWTGHYAQRDDGRTASSNYLQPGVKARIMQQHKHILTRLSDGEVAALAESRWYSFVEKRNPDDSPAKSLRKGKPQDSSLRDAVLHFVLELAAEKMKQRPIGPRGPRR
jgi:hypothetical protein